MSTITLPRATVEQALEALSSIVVCLRSRNGTPVSVALDEDKCAASTTALRAALKQEAKDQDPELSAALGWPGGISNPVLDRVQLLQMVAALRVSAQQALEALEEYQSKGAPFLACDGAVDALRAALAQEQDKPVTYSTGGFQLEAGFYFADQLREMLKALERMNAAARRAMEDMP